MSENSLISVIVTTFNSEKYIETALISAIEQTYENLEIIVIDDGSSDSTCRIVQSLADKDNRISLLKKEHSGNIGKNCNDAARESNGEFIAKLDYDDIWRKDKIEKQLEHVSLYKLVCSDAREINGNGEVTSNCCHCLGGDKEIELPLLLGNNYVINSSVLIHKDVFWECGGYEQDLGFRGEDYVLWLKVASKYKIKYLNETLVDYRIHGNNYSMYSVEEKLKLRENAISIRTKYLEGYGKKADYSAREGIILALKEQCRLLYSIKDYKGAAEKSLQIIKLSNSKLNLKNKKIVVFYLYAKFLNLIKAQPSEI